jgi:hypothetical protein
LLLSEHRMVRRLLHIYILLASVLLCPALANAQNEPVEPGDEQRRIRDIRIKIAPVFTAEQAEESSWAKFTNDYHILTHESVIRTQLLFKEGEVLDQEWKMTQEWRRTHTTCMSAIDSTSQNRVSVVGCVSQLNDSGRQNYSAALCLYLFDLNQYHSLMIS